MGSRTSAGVLVLLVCFGGLVATSPPSGAATPAAHALHGRPAAPAARPTVAPTAAPISSGYLEAPDAFGDDQYGTGSVTLPSGTTSGLTLQLDGSSLPGQIPGLPVSVTVQAASGQQLVPGQLYGTGHSGSVTVDSTNSCGSALVGDQAVAIVDQVRYDVASQVTSAAVQFLCFMASGSFQSYYGAFAFDVSASTPHQGYYTYEQDGLISGFGNDEFLDYLGDLSTVALNQPIVGMAQTADGAGYWMVAADGGIFAFGDAGFYGYTGNLHLSQPIVGMAATADGKGYWLVAADGGIFAFGDALFHGSTGGMHLNKPIVGMAATADGDGYWLVASDGGIFAFGDAGFYGSAGNLVLNQPVVGMTATADGKGYLFVASDGGIFAYGDARFHGSTGSLVLEQPIVGMASTPAGDGYWLVAADGGIFAFNAPFYGSLPASGDSVEDVVGLSV
jgi:hypothetical protein